MLDGAKAVDYFVACVLSYGSRGHNDGFIEYLGVGSLPAPLAGDRDPGLVSK